MTSTEQPNNIVILTHDMHASHIRHNVFVVVAVVLDHFSFMFVFAIRFMGIFGTKIAIPIADAQLTDVNASNWMEFVACKALAKHMNECKMTDTIPVMSDELLRNRRN